jgi:uncharacterized protein YkwD
MPRVQTAADTPPTKGADDKPANAYRRAFGRRLTFTLLVVMGAASIRPSSRLMASAEQSDEAQKPSAGVALRPAAAAVPDIPFTEYDSEAEQALLNLANQARSRAGVPTLKLDTGLTRAARAHAEAMFSAHQLSHQFESEPSLPQRLAEATQTQLDQEAENVALDYDAQDGHRHLMLSPPHRANLLNANYNVIGLGVVRSGDQLYIVQDFGHALPTYSVAELKDQVGAAVEQSRHRAKQGDLARRDLSSMDDAACSMAQAGKLGTSSIRQLAQQYTVLTYTTLHPEALPANAGGALSSHNLRNFSVGACYARSDAYPTGVYWVVLAVE